MKSVNWGMPVAVVAGTALIAVMLGMSSPVLGAASPNASRIAFESDRDDGNFGLFAMRPDGSGLVQFNAPGGAADAAWSPNGHRIAFETDPDGGQDPEIFVMDTDGTNVQQLTDSLHPDIWPDWFPNGKQLVFNSLRNGKPDIYVMNADGTDVRQLTIDPDTAGFHPQVSPNGQQVLYSKAPFGGPTNVFVMNADGTNDHAVTSGPYLDVDAVWSHDGQQIVFSSNRNGPSLEIFIMDADGSNITALTNTAGRDYVPAVSPDGKQIAWTKSVSGNNDIWVMNADGSGKTRLTFDPSFEGFPDWHQGHLSIAN